MRICVLSDCVFPTPLANGHGLGLMAWQIAEGLRGLGHDVTLIAKEGSQFSGTLHMPPDATNYNGEVLLARDAMRLHRSWPFDVFLDNGHLHVLSDIRTDIPIVNVFHDIYQEHARCPILLSGGQQVMMATKNPKFEKARIIHNALNDEAFPPVYETYSIPYALFMGVRSEIKQPLLAIEACARMGIELYMAGSDVIGRFPSGAHEAVHVFGAVSGDSKLSLLQNARVFLQLGTCESFGLTTLEANLCGTPVVAWPAGGSLDLIEYGVNGVFVPQGGNPVMAVADAIERAWDMDRTKVHNHAEQFADVNGQIHAYEEALIDTIKGNWW